MRFLFLMILTILIWSCQGPAGERAATGEAVSAGSVEEGFEIYHVDIETSNVEWVGARPASQHNGIVGLSEGHVKVSNGEIVGGEFVIDLTNIVVLDITDPGRNARLKGHLESDDFFDVENYPEAVFEITSVQAGSGDNEGSTRQVTGNLMMRGINRSVTFDVTVEIDEESVSARSVQFLINRTEWGVNYQSRTVFANLVDNFILDDIALVVNLNASK